MVGAPAKHAAVRATGITSSTWWLQHCQCLRWLIGKGFDKCLGDPFKHGGEVLGFDRGFRLGSASHMRTVGGGKLERGQGAMQDKSHGVVDVL